MRMSIKTRIPTKIIIEDVPGKGRGVYAIERIRRGEIIEVSPVVLYG